MKVLVKVIIPVISESYDVLIPDFLPVSEIVPLLVNAVKFLSNNRYVSSGHEFLCMCEPELLLREDKTIKDYNVKNGEKLIIM